MDHSSSESESSSPLDSGSCACSTAAGNQYPPPEKAVCLDRNLLGMTGSWEPEPCLANSLSRLFKSSIFCSCSLLLIGLFFFLDGGFANSRGVSRASNCFRISASTSGAYCMIREWIFQRVGTLTTSMSSSSVPSSPTY